MACLKCQTESQSDGLTPAGTYGTQTTCTCLEEQEENLEDMLSRKNTSSNIPLKREEMELLQEELHGLRASVDKLESQGSSTNSADTVTRTTELSDMELVKTLDELVGHLDMKRVHASVDDSSTETDSQFPAPPSQVSQFGFLEAPMERRDTAWHMKRLDALTVVEDEVFRAKHAELVEERGLLHLQVYLEKVRLRVMAQRVLARQKSEKRERLARAAHELRCRLKDTRLCM
ncbi:hypothetical protein VKT23_014746 [Stygiomarasmius scandens]|uniref:Uncharacterized protein n=1 Tax=Marasmiellus scandens TaxID=2682957 RepID=A0ABR1IZQ9_9AGAR